MAASSSSSPFFAVRDDDLQNQMKQSKALAGPSSSTPAQPPKKKRNQPGNPNPDAEVIALSPKTLLATNRYICEVCNKGFQREQNLQLHRRGHNLPWKLRQKSTKEVRRRVYLCPEPTCVHHHPSRALGDLTGIKKHFCRKHGEKKWKCDKCSKRYAVQSDWKAHSKTCGTREYRCDCGTLFSRRDSFITHRAFCDALAQESARLPTAGLGTVGSHLYGNNTMGLGLSHLNSQIQSQNHPSPNLLRLGGGGAAGSTKFDHLLSSSASSFRTSQAGSSSGVFVGGANYDENQTHHNLLQHKPFQSLMHLPDFQIHNTTNSVPSSAAPDQASTHDGTFFNLGFFSNTSTATTNNNSGSNNSQSAHLLMPIDQFNDGGGGNNEQANLFSGNLLHDGIGGSAGVPSMFNNNNTSVQNDPIFPQMSATALLQKAAQMGATATTNTGACTLRGFGSSSSSRYIFDKPTNFRDQFAGGQGDGIMRSHLDNETHLEDLMNTLTNGNPAGIYGGGNSSTFEGNNCTSTDGNGHHHHHQRQQQLDSTTGYGGFNTNLSVMDEAGRLHQNLTVAGMGGSDRLTRDFLGVGGGMARSVGRGSLSQRERHLGLDTDSLDYSSHEIKSVNVSRSFAGGALH